MTDGRLGEAGVGGKARGTAEAVAIRVHHDGGDSVVRSRGSALAAIGIGHV
jgi:hypothetical protein